LITTTALNAQALFQLNNHAKSASGWGVGSAISTLHNNFDGIFQNPALMAKSPKFYHLNYTDFVLDINTTSLNVGLENRFFKYSLAVSYMNFGNFTEKDIKGNTLGNFNANDKEFSLIVAKSMGDYLAFGFSGSYLNSKINNSSATTLSAAVGIQFYYPKEQLSVGLSLKNLDSQLDSYTDKTEELPNLLILGLSKKLKYLPAVISLDLLKFSNYDLIFNTGIKFNTNQYLDIMVGTSSRKFDLQNRTDLASLTAGISGGIGLNLNGFHLDMSYSSLGDAGEITSFSFYRIME